MNRLFWLGMLVASFAACALAAQRYGTVWRADRELAARLEQITPQSAGTASPCKPDGEPPPLVLLVLGQSNAGNHGAAGGVERDHGLPGVKVFAGAACRVTADPLPGGTGRYQSIWSRLPPQLMLLGVERPVLFVLLAVDATTVDDWTRAGSPLRARLEHLLSQLRKARLQPDMVLWQQGEADARLGTDSDTYMSRFRAMRTQLRQGGVGAPIMIARSTVCGKSDGRAVRAAYDGLLASHADLLDGPDTDLLAGSYRSDSCHFSALGLDAAATLWAKAIVRSTVDARRSSS